jgi:hypothetical protein
MKLTAIFAQNNPHNETDLWASHYDSSTCDEYENAFDNWYDPQYLLNFFSNNYDDLFSGFYNVKSIAEAIDKTIDDAFDFEEKLLDASYGRFSGNDFALNELFKPLNNKDYRYESDFLKSKARQHWLRLYSIKLHPLTFVISGSAIKLSLEMNRKHLEVELEKLDTTKNYLKENGYTSFDELKSYKP